MRLSALAAAILLSSGCASLCPDRGVREEPDDARIRVHIVASPCSVRVTSNDELVYQLDKNGPCDRIVKMDPKDVE